MSEAFVVLVFRVRADACIATSFHVDSDSCLSEAAALLSMARVGTRVTVFDGHDCWEGVADGRPASWLLCERRVKGRSESARPV